MSFEDDWAAEPATPPVLRTLGDGVAEALAEMDRYSRADFSGRCSTGIPRLDRRLRGGFAGGQLTLIGAPSGHGKTSLAMQIAVESACHGPTLLVSPEMSIAELAEREIIRRSGRELWDRNPWQGHDSVREFARLAHEGAAEDILDAALPLSILDRECSMAEVEAAAHALAGVRMVVLDYVQVVASMDPRVPRYLSVGDVGTRGVILSRALQIPVLVCSQVNTNTDAKRKSYTFRESAILEHKASVVLVLEVEWEDGHDGGARTVKSAEIVCLKQRHGPGFRLPVRFHPACYSITDIEPERYSPTRVLPALPPGFMGDPEVPSSHCVRCDALPSPTAEVAAPAGVDVRTPDPADCPRCGRDSCEGCEGAP